MNNPIELIIECEFCNRQETLIVESSDLITWSDLNPYQKTPDTLQLIFPYLSNDQKDLILLDTCKQCHDYLFHNGIKPIKIKKNNDK